MKHVSVQVFELQLHTNNIDLIYEDAWWWKVIDNSEKLPHKLGTISQILLNQFTTNNYQESSWCRVRHRLKEDKDTRVHSLKSKLRTCTKQTNTKPTKLQPLHIYYQKKKSLDESKSLVFTFLLRLYVYWPTLI